MNNLIRNISKEHLNKQVNNTFIMNTSKVFYLTNRNVLRFFIDQLVLEIFLKVKMIK